MSVLPIVRIGHPVLRRRTAELPLEQLKSSTVRTLIKAMVPTMRKAQGVGLAANQVGVGLNLAVLECRASRRYPGKDDFPLQAYANIHIVKYSKKQVVDWEGCLSVPGYRGLVPRSESVTFEALTPEGKPVKRSVKGFQARVIQHETDHLNGLCYLDRMIDMRSLTHLDEFK